MLFQIKHFIILLWFNFVFLDNILPLIAKQVGRKFTEFKIWVISPKVPSGAQNPPFPTINFKTNCKRSKGRECFRYSIKEISRYNLNMRGGGGDQCFIGNFVVRHQYMFFMFILN